VEDNKLVITLASDSERIAAKPEVCEHKGIGHPDSICDGVAEFVSHALCSAYLDAYGSVQHHNTDKALLIAGRSQPRFGGGEIIAPMRLIVGGRATTLPGIETRDLVIAAAREYVAGALRCDPGLFLIDSAIGEGSPNLRQVFARGARFPLANDTSVGAGYAPYSILERKVLELASILKSAEFRRAFPAAGDDYKIMGVRVGQSLRFTIALAFIDREIHSTSEYFDTKAAIVRHLEEEIGEAGAIGINLLDDRAATDERGIYLTATGLSAEQGDDGQVGRGNRTSGLITPSRGMSLEATAGKNPVAHVGKMYNVLAHEMARTICADVPEVQEASVQILSAIGTPVNEPQLIAIRAIVAGATDRSTSLRVEAVARGCLAQIDDLMQRLIAGEIKVF